MTGFFIPHANPPCGETDGPLGALFLARALVPLGIRVALITDAFCCPALEAGLDGMRPARAGAVVTLPSASPALALAACRLLAARLLEQTGPLTHLLALERVGPSHTPASLQEQLGQRCLPRRTGISSREVPPEHQDRCHTMRGLDITTHMSPAHLLFEAVRQTQV